MNTRTLHTDSRLRCVYTTDKHSSASLQCCLTCVLHLMSASFTHLISNFLRVLNVVCFLLGDSDAGESPKRKHTPFTHLFT